MPLNYQPCTAVSHYSIAQYHSPQLNLHLATSLFTFTIFCSQESRNCTITQWHQTSLIAAPLDAQPSSDNLVASSQTALIFSRIQNEAENIHNPKCTSDSFYGFRGLYCYTSHITLSILAKKMNISYELAEDPVPPTAEDVDAGGEAAYVLHICVYCNPRTHLEEIDDPSALYHVDHIQLVNLIYCFYKPLYDEPTFYVFLKPFDHWTWILILLSIGGIVALKRRAGLLLLSLLQLLIAQSPDEKELKRLGFGLSFSIYVALTFISFLYLDSVTTEMTTPLQEHHIRTNAEFLSQTEYQILAKNAMIREFIAIEFRVPRKYWESVFRIDPQFEWASLMTRPLSTFAFLAKREAAFIAPVLNRFPEMLESDYRLRFKNISCNLVKEKISPDNSLWTLRLEKGRNAKKHLSWLYSSGIPEHWSKLLQRFIMKHSYDESIKENNSTRSDFFYKAEIAPLALDSSPKILFYIYLILIGCALVVLLLEIIVKNRVAIKLMLYSALLAGRAWLRRVWRAFIRLLCDLSLKALDFVREL